MMKQISLAVAAVLALAVPALAQGTAAGDATRGKDIFIKDACYTCHGTTGTGGAAGPQLGHSGLNADAIKQQLRNPQARMPSYTEKVLSDAEIADIVAYIQSLSSGPRPTGKDIPLLNQ